MPRRKEATPTKASESVVSRMLSKLLRVPPQETVDAAVTAYLDRPELSQFRAIAQQIVGVYPWVTAVSQDVMASRTTPMTEHMMSLPGNLYVVKGTEHAGTDSLWLVGADLGAPFMESLGKQPFRGLVHTFPLGNDGDFSMITAIQLSSCQP